MKYWVISENGLLSSYRSGHRLQLPNRSFSLSMITLPETCHFYVFGKRYEQLNETKKSMRYKTHAFNL